MSRSRALVLLVDDEPVLLRVIGRVLAEGGYDVLTAATRADAIAIVRGEKPDVVVSDVALGHESGLDLVLDVREFDRLLPVILLSGHGVAGNVGAFKQLNKPVGAAALWSAVREALSSRAQQN
jgi:DNA-binding NtrC family response regulator